MGVSIQIFSFNGCTCTVPATLLKKSLSHRLKSTKSNLIDQIYDNFLYVDKNSSSGFHLGAPLQGLTALQGPTLGSHLRVLGPTFAECLQFFKKRGSGTDDSCEFCKISKNTFSYRTPQMAAAGPKKVQLTCVVVITNYTNQQLYVLQLMSSTSINKKAYTEVNSFNQ